MSDRVKRYLPILKRISKLGNKARREFIRKCDKNFIDCVSEFARNLIKKCSANETSDDQSALQTTRPQSAV